MLTTSSETSSQYEQGVLAKWIRMENVCRFCPYETHLEKWSTVSNLIGRQTSEEVNITLWWNSPVVFTLRNYSLWRSSGKNSPGIPAWQNQEKVIRITGGEEQVRCCLSSKIPVHNAEGPSGSAETVRTWDGLWGAHYHTIPQGSLFALSLINTI